MFPPLQLSNNSGFEETEISLILYYFRLILTGASYTCLDFDGFFDLCTCVQCCCVCVCVLACVRVQSCLNLLHVEQKYNVFLHVFRFMCVLNKCSILFCVYVYTLICLILCFVFIEQVFDVLGRVGPRHR